MANAGKKCDHSLTIFTNVGYGNGSFAPQLTFSVGADSQAIVIDDLNNDNKTDLVIANI
jgi:hypothetical protein